VLFTLADSCGGMQILTNATVRLYKFNTATNAYDAVEGGGPLGCVLMGMTTTYQILIYNGQVSGSQYSSNTVTLT
jgi:hypothetical protein